jgi:hypothetical protein
MARISVINTNLRTSIYLKELDKRQRSTQFPPGQDRYVRALDAAALTALLVSYGSAITGAALIAGTVTANNVSKATIQTVVSDVVLTADQLTEVQDAISYRIVETGNFQLSFDRGQLAALVANNSIKVFTEAGSALYTL